MEHFKITSWCHHFIKQHVKSGNFCIDATAGKGNDTLLLCQLVGSEGKVLAFDIQETAINATVQRLEREGMHQRAEVIKDSHINMMEYTKPDTVDCIVFNFGYLPGGDHCLATNAENSVKAVLSALQLLKTGGLLSLCIYSGGDSGFEEKDALLNTLKKLDDKKYLVIVSQYYNRPNHPPIPAIIVKLA